MAADACTGKQRGQESREASGHPPPAPALAAPQGKGEFTMEYQAHMPVTGA